MRALLVLAAVAAIAPAAAGASVVDVFGTLATWVPFDVHAEAGDTVRFRSLDLEHPAYVFGLVPDGGAYGPVTTYSDVPAGTYDFVCANHGWMTGTLVVQ